MTENVPKLGWRKSINRFNAWQLKHNLLNSMSEQDEEVTVDTSTEGEEATESNEDGAEGTVDLAAELEKERTAKAQLTARAKKAEAELKKLKENQPTHISNDPQVSPDELKLIARGLSDEEIEQAKVIAKGKDIKLTEAIKDPLFLTYQSDLKEKEKKEQAKLGASKGSGETAEEVTGLQSGATREEHEKAFKKLVGKK